MITDKELIQQVINRLNEREEIKKANKNIVLLIALLR